MSDSKSRKELLDAEYLGDLHHDLKNQIASIKAFGQLIVRKTEKDEVSDYANSIDERADQLLLMLNEFFDGVRGK